MALSDGRTRSTRLAFQQVDPAEHVTLPAETGSIPEVEEEEEEEADTDELPPNSVWHRTLTVEEEDFLRDVGKAVKGMEPGVLERWIVKNEAMYDRRNVKHWHNLSWDNAEYRDRHLSAGEGRELPERILGAYRSIILKELRETESPPSVQEEPEVQMYLRGNLHQQRQVKYHHKQERELRHYRAKNCTSMEHRKMERLSLESQQPHSVERARLMWQEWRFFEDTLRQCHQVLDVVQQEAWVQVSHQEWHRA
ncbi:hypothetical protein MVEG_04181 [Podila verticillata NRRL 6337]|nr:hypothetical protein MVEG_04181 [Podila verticillata NRRL 6337]